MVVVVVVVHIGVVFVAAVAVLSASRSLSFFLYLDPFISSSSFVLFESHFECHALTAIFVLLKMHPSSHINAPIRRRVIDLFHSRRLTFSCRSLISRIL